MITKFPSMSEAHPTVVFSIKTETPIKTSAFFASTILPEILPFPGSTAKAEEMKSSNTVSKDKRIAIKFFTKLKGEQEQIVKAMLSVS